MSKCFIVLYIKLQHARARTLLITAVGDRPLFSYTFIYSLAKFKYLEKKKFNTSKLLSRKQ
jgi:hypothetical protein